MISTEGDAFKIRVVDDFGNARLESNAPGNILLKLLKEHIPNDSRFNALYKFEPYLGMAMSYFVKFNLYPLLLSWNMVGPASEARKLMAYLNECVDQIRQEAKSKQFQSKLNDYNRLSNKNYKAFTEYVEALFGSHSRLLVLRVDLSYRKEFSKTTQAEAKQDRERLFENARSNKLFADMVGYIWKLEHGPEKGFHYHMMFFFDGSKVREDGTLAKLIGEYWETTITKGRGVYYNCNAVKGSYKDCGIGMVHYADGKLREGLRKAVIYLTKTDLYMKLQTEGRSMGRMNRPSQKDARGRPRAVPLSGSA